ncbi:MAG: DUF2334 domain-containing protein [Victivallaceae bacterium]|nr:DUF2334 domain-containing protein [Victivallaceae bacterium]
MISFRIDDVCDRMDFAKFKLVVSLLQEANASPLLGVVPDCRDEKLMRWSATKEFDGRIKEYLANGCEIAMHGYRHLYDSQNTGLLKAGFKSEFAGHHMEIQRQRIQDGLKIMQVRGFNPQIFMAPSHTFDLFTLAALFDAGFRYVTDGYTSTNYSFEGLKFIPCRNTVSLRMPLYGIVTVCLHTNHMDETAILRLKLFLKKYVRDVVPFRTLLSQKDVGIFRETRENFYRYRMNLLNFLSRERRRQ